MKWGLSVNISSVFLTVGSHWDNNLDLSVHMKAKPVHMMAKPVHMKAKPVHMKAKPVHL